MGNWEYVWLDGLGKGGKGTNRHVQQLAGPHNSKEAVYVVKNAQEDLSLGGGCSLPQQNCLIV